MRKYCYYLDRFIAPCVILGVFLAQFILWRTIVYPTPSRLTEVVHTIERINKKEGQVVIPVAIADIGMGFSWPAKHLDDSFRIKWEQAAVKNLDKNRKGTHKIFETKTLTFQGRTTERLSEVHVQARCTGPGFAAPDDMKLVPLQPEEWPYSEDEPLTNLERMAEKLNPPKSETLNTWTPLFFFGSMGCTCLVGYFVFVGVLSFRQQGLAG